MLVSIALILLVVVGGLALSYVIERDETLLWRLSVGVVIGSCVYGTVAFVFGCFTGIAVASPMAGSQRENQFSLSKAICAVRPVVSQ